MNKSQFKIGSKVIGDGSTYFVIEEGQANLGNFELALEMIDLAASTGADAIEFQLAQAAEFYIKSHIGYGLYKEREFSDSQLLELVNYTTEKGLDMVVAPLSSKLIETMALNGCAAFNVNASDLINPDILDRVSEIGKPFFLSLLLAEENEIEWAINRISRRSNVQFGLLLGQHTMASGGHGVDLEHTNLGYLSTLKKRYNVPVGFIDHSSQVWSPAVAVAAGADLVTKHLAISRAEKGPDWQVCLEQNEMIESIGLVRAIDSSITSVEKKDILFWAICIKNESKHIGNIKIDPVEIKHGICEYGIMMGDKNEWGKGFAKEASKLVIEFCFKSLNLRKMNLGVIESNTKAVNLYMKLHFNIEGKLINHINLNGKFVNVLRMSLFNNNYIEK
jgi:sialic acid synthase SpsE